MPLRHGTSHALAVVLCTVLGAFLIELVRPAFPDLANFFLGIAEWMVDVLQVPMEPRSLSVVLVAAVLAFLWGIIFRLRTGR